VYRARKVIAHLSQNLPCNIVVRTDEKKGSGTFELARDEASGKVYHSKLGGDGHLDCYPDKLAKVVEAIKADL
jgi:hypothetical protein